MKVKLVLDDWRKVGESKSIYNTDIGLRLSSGELHSGTVFDAELIVDSETEEEIRDAYDLHEAYPTFRVIVK